MHLHIITYCWLWPTTFFKYDVPHSTFRCLGTDIILFQISINDEGGNQVTEKSSSDQFLEQVVSTFLQLLKLEMTTILV